MKAGGEFLVQNKFGEKLIDTDEDQFLCCIGGLDEEKALDGQEHIVEMDYSE